MTDTNFDVDDEPVLTAEGEAAAAICGHRVVMQRGGALTADMLDEFHGFVQEELAALLEEKNAEIAMRLIEVQILPLLRTPNISVQRRTCHRATAPHFQPDKP